MVPLSLDLAGVVKSVAAIPRRARSISRRAKWTYLASRFRLPAVAVEQITDVPRSEVAALILDDVCMPPFLGTDACDDIGTVLRIAIGLRPRLICEIGTAHGNLAANLLRNCADAELLTVNAPKELQSGTKVTYELTEDQIGRVYLNYGYGERVRQVFVNSLDLALIDYIQPGSADLAIIDGCHDTEFVVNDFEKVRDFIKPGGVVLFHDTHPSQWDHLAGSYRACLLLRQRGVDVRWIQNTWWGVWQRRSQ